MFLLGEVTDEVVALAVASREDIKQERLNVVIKRFVVEEKFREQAEILAVNLVRIAVDFEDGNFSAAVDFRARWIPPCALVEVTVEDELAFGVLEAELAEKKFRESEREFLLVSMLITTFLVITSHTLVEMEMNTTSRSHVCRIQSPPDIVPAPPAVTLSDSVLRVNSPGLVL